MAGGMAMAGRGVAGHPQSDPAQLDLLAMFVETEDPRSPLEARLDLAGAYVTRFARLFARRGAMRVVVTARSGGQKVYRFNDCARAAVFCAAVRIAGLHWRPARA
jgi:hypothetical protein